MSFSVGQVAYVSKKVLSFDVHEGVQQVYVKTITTTKEFGAIKDVYLYPNPASEVITLLFSNAESRPIQYSLTDHVGRDIKNGMIGSEKTELSLKNLPSGNYLLILTSQIEKRVFNVVKM
jgi:hypothetical protein